MGKRSSQLRPPQSASSLDLILPEPLAPSTGLVTMDADLYHADPAPSPSLSSGIAKLLLTVSPAHARIAHPKLNPDFEPTVKDSFDLGTVAHQLLLEGETSVCVVDAADWRTAAAKTAKEEARANGQTPLLAKDWARVEAMANAARRQLELTGADPAPLTNGMPEQTLVWDDGDGVWCRCRLDWTHNDMSAVDDLKTTAASADPGKWGRTMFQIGADLQAAFYLRGLKKALGVEPQWRFLVQENYKPYALSVVTLSDELLDNASRRVDQAITIWKQCLADNHWPGYSRNPATILLPAWMSDAPSSDFGDAPF